VFTRNSATSTPGAAVTASVTIIKMIQTTRRWRTLRGWPGPVAALMVCAASALFKLRTESTQMYHRLFCIMSCAVHDDTVRVFPVCLVALTTRDKRKRNTEPNNHIDLTQSASKVSTVSLQAAGVTRLCHFPYAAVAVVTCGAR
jgi:hypothetical protein